MSKPKHKNNKSNKNGQKSQNPALAAIKEKMQNTSEQEAETKISQNDIPAENLEKVEPVKIVIPDEELTSADKERLIQEGEIEKARIIGQATAEAEKKAIDIVESATTKRDELLKEYKDTVKQEALDEFEAEKAEKIKELEEREHNIEENEEIVAGKLSAVETRDGELAEKMAKYVTDNAKLQVEKSTYKTQVVESVKDDISRIESERDSYKRSYEESQNELRKTKKLLEATAGDKEIYEEDSQNNSANQAEITKLRLSNERLENDKIAISKELTECQENLRKKEILLLKFGDDPNALISANTALAAENRELRDTIKNCPAEEELSLLRQNANILSQKETRIRELEAELSKINAQLTEATNYEEDLDNYKRYIRVLELQKRELQKELDRIIDTYNNNSTKVFVSLSNIDKTSTPPSHSTQNISLEELCKNFRIYAASRKNNPLYYSEQHIRTFVAGFAACRLFILEGLSGTGKSKLPEAFAEYIDCVTSAIPVQSAWKDRNDLLGFYNDFEKRYKETDFLKEIYKATRDSDNIHLITLDEMNLSRIEYYFADFLSIIEKDNPDNWKINLIADNVRGEMPQYIVDGNIQVLTNTWFIGTANKDDSTFMITDKVYDRAIVLEFNDRDEPPVLTGKAPSIIHMSNSEFQNLLNAATRKCKDEGALSSLIKYLDTEMREFKITFGYRIDKQIRNFVAAYETCGGTMLEAVDIIFSSKVLRKLQGFYDESTKKKLNALWDKLTAKYPKDADFQYSKSAIEEMIEKLG